MTDQSFNFRETVPDILSAMSKVHGAMAKHDLDRKLQHLVELRASQINACGYCVKLHTKEAREDGETNGRLDRLVVWRHVDDFTPAEQAAFAWTEALTSLSPDADLETLRQDLKEHYTNEQIGVLTSLVAMINLWNRIQRSAH